MPQEIQIVRDNVPTFWAAIIRRSRLSLPLTIRTLSCRMLVDSRQANLVERLPHSQAAQVTTGYRVGMRTPNICFMVQKHLLDPQHENIQQLVT